jgi:hypothetical protein
LCAYAPHHSPLIALALLSLVCFDLAEAEDFKGLRHIWIRIHSWLRDK